MGLLNVNKKYCYVLEMEVRDYELDCEGIVNNANYLHYMEHTRHKFCADAGFSFIEMHQSGIDPVVRKIEMVYLSPLRGGEKFLSCIKLERKGPRFIFQQDIMRPDGTMVLNATVTCVVIKNGKPTRGDELAGGFSKYLS